jgi:hypothetical protein
MILLINKARCFYVMVAGRYTVTFSDEHERVEELDGSLRFLSTKRPTPLCSPTTYPDEYPFAGLFILSIATMKF